MDESEASSDGDDYSKQGGTNILVTVSTGIRHWVLPIWSLRSTRLAIECSDNVVLEVCLYAVLLLTIVWIFKKLSEDCIGTPN